MYVLGGPGSEASPVKTAANASFIAALAAVFWIVLGIESIVRPEQENYRDGLWMLPFALTAIAFVYVHVLQRNTEMRFEKFTFWFLIAASVLVFSGNVGLLGGWQTLSRLNFPWDALLWMLGLIVFGIGTWRTRVLPRYVGITLVLLEPASILTGLALSPIAAA
jgi:hypothetical protein